MATFQLYTSSALTTPITVKELLHKTDQSDNPQVLPSVFLGSTDSSRELGALSNYGVDDLVLSIVDTLPEWEADTSYSLGDRVQEVGGGSYVWEVTTAGTSDSSEPSWNAGGLGSTTADNDIVWTKRATHHTIEEITLALTEGELDTNTPGDSLPLGPTISGGTGGALEIFIKVENSVTVVSNSASQYELALELNDAIEIEP